MAEPSKADIAMTASNPISAANGTIRAMVGHFTRVENQIKDIAAMASSSSVPSTTSYDELSSLLSELKLRQSNVSTAYDTLMTIDPNAIEKSNNRLDDIAKKYSSSVGLVNDALAHLDGLVSVSPGRVSFKANIGLQPFKLSRDANPEEVRTWIRAFRAFYSTSNMQVLAVVDQQAYFLASLEPSLALILSDSIDDATPVLSDGGCVELLEQRFREVHPVFARRCALFSFRKIKSTRFADAYHQLRKQSDECELSSFNIQRDLLAFIMIRSCDDDPGLYTRLLELDNPDMTELLRQAKLYENARHPVPSEHVAALRETTSPQEVQRPKSWIYVCHGCGSEQHKKEQCPFKFTTCYDCNRTGHIANVCGEYSRGRKPYRNNAMSSGRSPYKSPKRNRERRTGTPVERNRSSSSARISAINEFTTKHDTPRILITCSFRSKKLLAIPDTGATRTVLPLTAIPDEALIRPSRTRLSAANGTQMASTGAITFTATVNSGPEAIIDALVSKDLTGPALISWHDLMALGILSSDFPTPARQDTTVATVLTMEIDNLDAIKSDFADVLCNSLGAASGCIKGEPMKIVLDPTTEVKPIQVPLNQ
ncbi:uncharacterized protein LOC131880009 [Tigriopus californicus]|uniref:uncharacterized protein LOC131880009 n=1 Tax=Tigriopus californicus TaxID=6832 RepID=UPI0027DA9218|nr:uncharacterized protein LOC131880009 [Tigriopus californicus]